MSRNYSRIAKHRGLSGSLQTRRMPRALAPDYVKVDSRSASDIIEFALKYSTGVAYYDENNVNTGLNWLPFFCVDPSNPPDPSDDPAFRKDADDLAAYLEDPSVAESDPRLSTLPQRSNIALFLAFVRQLLDLQKQLNGLTERHLQFYLERYLHLSPREPVPDKLHVSFEVADSVSTYELPGGTELDAGTDAQGNPVRYATDQPVYLTQGKVASLKSLSALNGVLDIKATHIAFRY
ncbi:MAG: hypothetical protein AAF585_18255, partial [Verrucomicrobiota bacterium]